MSSNLFGATFALVVLLLFLPACLSIAFSSTDNGSSVANLATHDDDEDHAHGNDDDHDEDEHGHDEKFDPKLHEMKLKLHAAEMKLEGMDIELDSKRLQHERVELGRIYSLVSDKQKMAFFVIMHANDFMDEKEAIKVLKGCAAKTKDGTIKRTIQLKLIQLAAETDNDKLAKKQLEQIILGDE